MTKQLTDTEAEALYLNGEEDPELAEGGPMTSGEAMAVAGIIEMASEDGSPSDEPLTGVDLPNVPVNDIDDQPLLEEDED